MRIPLVTSVLMKGINDDAKTQMELVHKLVEMRMSILLITVPDLTRNSSLHSIETGIDIIYTRKVGQVDLYPNILLIHLRKVPDVPTKNSKP